MVALSPNRGLSLFFRLQRWQELGRDPNNGSTCFGAGNGAVEAVKSSGELQLRTCGSDRKGICLCIPAYFWKCNVIVQHT